MGAGISPMGMNMPQQPQGQGKGGGGRSQFNQQLMNLPGFANSLQASQQRMAQDPNANMMRTQPALPAGYDPNVHQRGFGVMVQPSQAPSQIPAGMQGDQLRMQQDQQMSMDALNQARQAGLQVGPTPNQVPNPYAGMSVPQLQQMNEQIRMQQMQMQANALQGRRLAPQVNDQMQQPMQQPMQQALQQQMQAQRQMQNMDPRQMQNMQQALQAPRQMQNMQPMPRDPRFGGLGALMQARRGPRQSIFQARNGMGKGGGGFFR